MSGSKQHLKKQKNHTLFLATKQHELVASLERKIKLLAYVSQDVKSMIQTRVYRNCILTLLLMNMSVEYPCV